MKRPKYQKYLKTKNTETLLFQEFRYVRTLYKN